MSHSNVYDGSRVVEHVVAQGQSLAKIAAIYQMADWRAIDRYNREVVATFPRGQSPDLLRPGQRLLIPRSRQGYRAWQVALKKLIAELEGVEIQEVARIEELEALQQAEDEWWNFAGSAVTAIAGLGVKAIEAGKAAMVSRELATEGSAVINSLRFTWAAVDDFVDEADDLFSGFNAALRAAQKKLRSAGAEKLFDKSLELVPGGVAKELVLARKILKSGLSGKRAIAEGERVIKHMAEGAADTTLAVLEYMNVLKVTTFRAALLWLWGAESITVEQEARSRKVAIEKTIGKQLRVLAGKLDAIEREKTLVWG